MTTSLTAASLRTLWVMTLSIVGGLALVGTALGFFGGSLWALDVLANFRVHLLVVLAVVGLLYFVSLGRVGLVFLAGAVVNLVVVFPVLWGSAQDDVPGSGRLDVVVFNVQLSNPSRAEVASWLDETEPDIALILESSTDWAGTFRRANLDYHIHADFVGDRSFGITVLTRDNLLVESQSVEDEQVVRIHTELDGQPVTIIGVHPDAPTTAASAEHRDDVLRAVSNMAATTPGAVVVAGDLNATPWSFAFRNLESTAGLVNSQVGFGYQPTWPAHLRYLAIPIDHVLHSPELTTIDRRIGPELGSDHLPLVVTLAPAKSSGE